MSSSSTVAAFQDTPEYSGCWLGDPFIKPHFVEDLKCTSTPARVSSGEMSSSGDELIMPIKVRKPYTITKQREKWTEEEHKKFLEALKLYGRAWRRIEEHIGTKTIVQIRSHAQKFFSKLEREALLGGLAGKFKEIVIPPPRPKRKPSHPYPRKTIVTQHGTSALGENGRSLPQPAAFSSNVGKGKPEVDTQDLSFGSPHLNGLHASLKLFGKTVVIPSTQSGTIITTVEARQDDGKPFIDISELTMEEVNGNSFIKDKPSSSNVVSLCKQDLRSRSGFSPYVKPGEKLAPRSEGSYNLTALKLDLRVLESGISTLEGTDDSNPEDLCIEGDVQIQSSELKIEDQPSSEFDVSSQPLPCKINALHKTGILPKHIPMHQERNIEISETCNFPSTNSESSIAMSAGVQPPAFIGTSATPYFWMENYLRYCTGVAVPSSQTEKFSQFVSSYGPTDSHPEPWQLLQALGLHYSPTYASTIPTVGWPGLTMGPQSAVVSDRCTNTECYAPFKIGYAGPTAIAAATFAAASTIWALHGVWQPRVIDPAAVAYGHMGVPVHTNASVSAIVLNRQDQERDVNPETLSDGDATITEEPEPEKDCHIKPSTLQQPICTSNLPGVSRPVKMSSVVEIPVEISKCENTIVVAAFTGGFEENGRALAERHLLPASPGSSSDEDNGEKKRPREGSSSDSNSPYGHQTSDSNTPNSCESDISGSYTYLNKHVRLSGSGMHSTGYVSNLKMSGQYVHMPYEISKETEANGCLNDNIEISEGHGAAIPVNAYLKTRLKRLEEVDKPQIHMLPIAADGVRKRIKRCAHETTSEGSF